MGKPSEADVAEIAAGAYEAALDAALWPGIVERLRAAFGALSANITVYDPGCQHGFVVNAGSDPAMIESYVAYYVKTDPRPTMIARSPLLGRAITRTALLPDAVMVRTELYADWLRPQGIWHGLVAATACGDELFSGVALSRERHQDEFGKDSLTALEALLPHFGRAIRTSCRLAQAEARATGVEGLLARLRDGAVLLHANGAVLYANPVAETLLRSSDGLTTAQGKLRATSPQDDAALRRAVAAASAGGSRMLAVARPSGRASLAVSVQAASARRQRVSDPWRIAPVPAALVLVVEPDRHGGGTAAIIRALYGLTVTEAVVAERVAEGQGTKDAAEALGIAPSTLRWHLQQIFEKTGTSRQAELARLIERTGLLAENGRL